MPYLKLLRPLLPGAALGGVDQRRMLILAIAYRILPRRRQLALQRVMHVADDEFAAPAKPAQQVFGVVIQAAEITKQGHQATAAGRVQQALQGIEQRSRAVGGAGVIGHQCVQQLAHAAAAAGRAHLAVLAAGKTQAADAVAIAHCGPAA